ncbi:AbfB domain-containing protein [Nocardia farcinica]|uniref:AbfB domain-containing protein n=1 Tax=Nocardia farcinica TaxID=37329 RepID=UPI00245772B4|nr:AbfB domain-containing protein [Nocardia farcinica]
MGMKISMFSNKFQDHFIVERQGLADIAPIETPADRENASFEWTGPGLVLGPDGAPADGFGASGQLRRAGAPFGFVLMIATFEDNRIHGKFADGITDPQVAEEVRKNSTFVLEKGLIDPNHVSFRSARFPDLFIQQVNFQLFARLARPQFPDEFQAATFRMVTPPLNAADM